MTSSVFTLSYTTSTNGDEYRALDEQYREEPPALRFFAIDVLAAYSDPYVLKCILSPPNARSAPSLPGLQSKPIGWKDG